MKGKPAAVNPPSAELIQKYNQFVKGVQPESVRLAQASMVADRFEGPAPIAEIEELSPRWHELPTGFVVLAPLNVRGLAGAQTKVDISVELALEYASVERMTEEFFPLFVRMNLPVNARPFLREAIANLTMRAGWPPLILPAFHRPGRKPAALPQKTETRPAARVAEPARRKK